MQKIATTEQEAYSVFYENSHIEGRYTAFIRGNRCNTLRNFFIEYSAAFQFPWYFGENWAAWDECATDLEWLSFQSVALVIWDYDKMFCAEPEREQLLTDFEKELIAIEDYWNNFMSIPFVVIACKKEKLSR